MDVFFVIKVIVIVSSVIIWQFVLKMIFAGASESAPSNSKDYHMIRRVMHMSTGVVILILAEVIGEDMFALCAHWGWIVFGLFCVFRKFNEKLNQKFIHDFRFLLRPNEYQGVPGSFFFLLGIAFVAQFYPTYILRLSIVNLAFGDPFASLCGLFFKSPMIRKSRSVAGTLGGAAFSCLFTWILIFIVPDMNCINSALPQSTFYLIVFLVSGISELAPSIFDDNLTIPAYSGILYSLIFQNFYGIKCH